MNKAPKRLVRVGCVVTALAATCVCVVWYLYFHLGTEYAPQYSSVGFYRLSVGDPISVVQQRIGDPLYVYVPEDGVFYPVESGGMASLEKRIGRTRILGGIWWYTWQKTAEAHYFQRVLSFTSDGRVRRLTQEQWVD